MRIYQQINPLQMLVASNLDQRDYASYYTREDNIKGCPKLCFTQIDLVIDDFINMYQQDLASYNVLPNIPSGRLYDCIKELLDNRNKVGKTISLASIFPKLGYRWLKHGFWISEKEAFHADGGAFFPRAGGEARGADAARQALVDVPPISPVAPLKWHTD